MSTRTFFSRALHLIVCTALCCILAPSLHAQGVADSRGREFYLTFPPNFHEHPQSRADSDSLYIFIAATQPTKGTIVYRNNNGTKTTRTFAIQDVSTVYTLTVHWRDAELASEYSGPGYDQNTKVAPQSFHITADNDVSVYALSYSSRSSDAMMVLPVDVLGTDYVVLSYNSDGNDNSPTPSQFAVVATQDNTSVVIKPSARVNGSTTPLSVRLNSGESYLVQADVSALLPSNDLTGTSIRADKPVAVFAGHQRSLIPFNSSSLISRDYLVEQLPPVQSWGKRYLLTPFPQPANLSTNASDIYRVLAANDNTAVSINGVQKAVLRAGQVYEAALKTAAVVEASDDILVAQYKRSSGTQSNTTHLSDPFMLIVPPVRQYLSSYLCISAQTRRTVYQQQYITILCPTAFTHTVQIDGKNIDQTLFQPVPTSCYSYAIVHVQDGSHRVEAATGIGIYLYGYGEVDSYGYVGGMAFRKYRGEGGNIAFSVTPELINASPGDTIQLAVQATSTDWQDMIAVSFSMELSYQSSWMQYTGIADLGTVLDSTWTMEVQELAADEPGMHKTVISARGTTPVAMSGTLAALQMRLFLSPDTLYTPMLSAAANGDINCVQTSTASFSVALSHCIINLRPVHYSGTSYSLSRIQAASSTGVLRLRYGIAIEAGTRIELYNSVGEHIATLVDQAMRPGEYEQDIDISRFGAGAYFIRMNSGPYSRTLPVLLGM